MYTAMLQNLPWRALSITGQFFFYFEVFAYVLTQRTYMRENYCFMPKLENYMLWSGKHGGFASWLLKKNVTVYSETLVNFDNCKTIF